MKEVLLKIVNKQNDMNCKVDPDWISLGWPLYRAVWTEAAEMLNHTNWEWWKHKEADRIQMALELVDIFHFGVSIMLVQANKTGASLDDIAYQLDVFLGEEPETLRGGAAALEMFVCQTIEFPYTFAIKDFTNVMYKFGLNPKILCQLYVGKNVLNMFRQDHGYKVGSYIKIWNGKEDNVIMASILGELQVIDDDYETQIYNALEAEYATVT